MERRLFLAIGLSMLVVWLYSFNVPKPKSSPLSKSSQIVEKDNVRVSSSDPVADAPASQSPVALELPDEKTIEIIDSERLEVGVSNIGGTIDQIRIKAYDTDLPVSGIMGLTGYDHLPFVVTNGGQGEIISVYENDTIKITKKFSVIENDNIIEASVLIANKTDMSKQISVNTNSFSLKMSSLDSKDKNMNRTAMRDRSLNEYVVNSEAGIFRKSGAYKFSEKEQRSESGKIAWTGFRNRYYCLLVKPQYETQGYDILPKDGEGLDVIVRSSEIVVSAQGNVQFDSIIYAGPEKINQLKDYGYGFEKIRRYYKFALFDGIAKIIAGIMRTLHNMIPNWGICIIIISIIIYFSMYPLTMRGMLSMKRMQALQPMIMKLREKYKDNPEKMNKEMMELYKEHKVNPLGGCLPMLLQMPVFIGLYQVLWRSVAFKGANFLWIKDLSEPDRLFILPGSLPVIGNEINILPLVMVVVMFFQQKLTAKNMVVSDPSQAAQQKMMATIMPIFLGFIFYKFASGLTLYFTMFYIFSTFTQWRMSLSTKAS